MSAVQTELVYSSQACVSASPLPWASCLHFDRPLGLQFFTYKIRDEDKTSNSKTPQVCVCVGAGGVCLYAQLCLTLCDPMVCSPPGYSVHGILQARILEWVAISSSRVSSQPWEWTQISCIGRRILYQLSHPGSPHKSIPAWKCECHPVQSSRIYTSELHSSRHIFKLRRLFSFTNLTLLTALVPRTPFSMQIDWPMDVLSWCDTVGLLPAGKIQIFTPFSSSPEPVNSEDLVITYDYCPQQSWGGRWWHCLPRAFMDCGAKGDV